MSAWPKLAMPVAVVAFAAFAASCTDPVLDDKIDALGGEVDGVDPGPDHRPGQPCVLCHSAGGPASDDVFALAGTVYETADARVGAPGVEILLVDSHGTTPTRVIDGNVVPILTSRAGNFFVRDTEWPDLRFPVKTAISRDTYHQMQSHIAREPSCAGCHRDPDPKVFGDRLSAVGHIYVK
jgi:hypothetical protein